MTEKELPKRRFALEEKDLAVEADENNKVAEEKENKFLKKIQEDATKDIEHLPTEKVLERLPDPTGWRMLVLPFRMNEKSKGGVLFANETVDKQQVASQCGNVLAMGPDCYKDKDRFQEPWCKVCLLYTSPSPRDATLSRMPSSA